MLCMWCVSPREICLKSNKTMYDCDATVLLNVYIHFVFVGNGYAALVRSNLPRLRELSLMYCKNVRDKYVEELEAAVPKVVFFGFPRVSGCAYNLDIENTY